MFTEKFIVRVEHLFSNLDISPGSCLEPKTKISSQTGVQEKSLPDIPVELTPSAEAEIDKMVMPVPHK